MYMLNIVCNNKINYFTWIHIFIITIFTLIYYRLFCDIDKHFIESDNLSKEEFLQDKLVNSLYLSINMQTTTGNIDFYIKSPIAKYLTGLQMFISFIISVSFFYIK